MKKNFAFFDQKHGLTPFEKCDYKDFETFSFYSQKRFFFSTNSLSIFLDLFLPETNKKNLMTE